MWLFDELNVHHSTTTEYRFLSIQYSKPFYSFDLPIISHTYNFSIQFSFLPVSLILIYSHKKWKVTALTFVLTQWYCTCGRCRWNYIIVLNYTLFSKYVPSVNPHEHLFLFNDQLWYAGQLYSSRSYIQPHSLVCLSVVIPNS